MVDIGQIPRSGSGDTGSSTRHSGLIGQTGPFANNKSTDTMMILCLHPVLFDNKEIPQFAIYYLLDSTRRVSVCNAECRTSFG